MNQYKTFLVRLHTQRDADLVAWYESLPQKNAEVVAMLHAGVFSEHKTPPQESPPAMVALFDAVLERLYALPAKNRAINQIGRNRNPCPLRANNRIPQKLRINRNRKIRPNCPPRFNVAFRFAFILRR